MKHLKYLKQLIVRSRLGWRLIVHSMHITRFIPGTNRMFQSLLFTKCSIDHKYLCQLAHVASPTGQVKSGPFSGMIYPSLSAAGSMLCPKILGTYEKEIANIFASDYLNQFDSIVDIGCAEGYYAVGCAIKTTKPKILAFDTSAKARDLCQQMATANSVSERLDIKGACTSTDLCSLKESRSLVISDCEGYENELFSKDVTSCLDHSDIVIEVHNQFGVDVNTLRKLFSTTHSTQVIYSKTDFEKSIDYDLPELEDASILTIVEMLAECRPLRMV